MRYRSEPLLLAMVCLAVIAGYFWIAAPATAQYGLTEPGEQHFNQLVAGFRSGHLWLKTQPSPELAKLADPYDPAQNAKYQLHDASYYHGRFYIYYGIAPVLVLFWPYVALTGHYLAQKYAVAVFCSLGFLVGALIVCQLRSRLFPKAGTLTFLAMVAAMGLVNCASFLMRRPEMYEVAESCAFAMTMAALASLGGAMGGGRRALSWLTLSSLFFGLAVASRPTFLLGAASILFPVWYLYRYHAEPGRRSGYFLRLGVAAFAPLSVVGIVLASYNYLRFGDPFEFGIKYLMMDKEVTRFFAIDWAVIWLNVRFYLFLPTRLSSYFPFVRGVAVPDFPPAFGFIENPFGVIPNIPFLLLAFAAPLAWLRLEPAEARRLRLFAVAFAWVALTSFGVLLIYIVACIRYEFDFTPYLTVLAVLGVFGIENALADRPAGRRWARLGWVGALVISAAFNFFGSCQHLGVLRKDAPGEYLTLARIFNYPTYVANSLLSSAGSRASPGGPAALDVRLGTAATGRREALLVIGTDKDARVTAFVRNRAVSQISVGFEFPRGRFYESSPVRVNPAAPLGITVSSPQLVPALGDPRWGSVPYGTQLLVLGIFSITVNGESVLAFRAPVDWPVDREAPCFPVDGLVLRMDRRGPAACLRGISVE